MIFWLNVFVYKTILVDVCEYFVNKLILNRRCLWSERKANKNLHSLLTGGRPVVVVDPEKDFTRKKRKINEIRIRRRLDEFLIVVINRWDCREDGGVGVHGGGEAVTSSVHRSNSFL